MYRTSAAIESINQILAAWFPSMVDRIPLEPSSQGRPISALRIRAGSAANRRAVVLVGGTHARELMNPDLLVDLVIKLIVSYKTNSDIVLGGKTWHRSGVKTMMEVLDIVVLPNVNPDGREYVLGGQKLWRKNRRALSASCVGVDLNRNYDLLWGIQTYHPSYGYTTSASPCSDQYFGPGAFSEPETRNVKKLLDDHDVDGLVDVHSYKEWILHPWGHAPNQTTSPSQRFTLVDTLGWSVLPNDAPTYKEYMPSKDFERFKKVGQSAADAIYAVRGRTYEVHPGTDLYPTTGTTSDYAYSRHVADSSLRRTYGFTFETGYWAGTIEKSFQPDFPEATNIMEEAMSGLLSILHSCVCAIHFIGVSLFGARAEAGIEAMREFRDESLLKSESGATWIELLETHQPELMTRAMAEPAFSVAAGELVMLAGEILDSKILERNRVVRLGELLDELGKCKISPELRGDLRRLRLIASQLEGMPVSDTLSFITETAYDDALTYRSGRAE